ncbi:MAG: glycosyltransferase family 4 protein [Clostridiales bacterium]|nr:glycosyltransferase family 4 protein [Clostridiales bacterium]
MKVLILTNIDVGLYNFRKEMIETLLSAGHEVWICLPDGERVPQLVEMGCRFAPAAVDRRGKNPLKDLSLFFRYLRLLKEIRPDIVLTFTAKPNIYGGLACRLRRVPSIANITGLGSAIENGGLLSKFTLFLYRLALKKSKRVFFQNVENAQLFSEKKIALGRHKLLPGSGVNLAHFTPLPYPPEYRINFVCIGRVMREKGIEEYLAAARYFREKYPQTRFHICGFCEEAYEDVLAALQSEGIIKYHGEVDDMRDVLRDIHCTVHPSYYPEGMSNALLESAACARPLITTDRSGCREVVDDGVNGYLVRQKDTEDLIEKIERFLALSHTQKKAMGRAGREKVARAFDRQIVTDAYMREISGE